MNCKQAEEWIIDFLYGELDPDRVRELKEHYNHCSDCAAELTQFGQLRTWAINLAEPEPSKIAINRIIAHSREEARKTRPIWVSGWVKILGTLSLMVVVAMAVTYQLNNGLVSDKAMINPSLQPTADIRYENKDTRPPAEVRNPAPARSSGRVEANPEPRVISQKTAGLRAASPAPASMDRESDTGAADSAVKDSPPVVVRTRTLIANPLAPPQHPPAKEKSLVAAGDQGPPQMALNVNQPSPPPPAAAKPFSYGDQVKADATTLPPPIQEVRMDKPSSEGVLVVNGSSTTMALNLDRPQYDQAPAGVQAGPGRMQLRSLETTTTTMIIDRPSPEIADYLTNGTRALDDGKFHLAIQMFEKVLPQLMPGHPDRPNVLLGLAQTYEALGEPVKAREYYKALLAESPGHQEMALRKINELSDK